MRRFGSARPRAWRRFVRLASLWLAASCGSGESAPSALTPVPTDAPAPTPTPTPVATATPTPPDVIGRWVTTGPDGGKVAALALDPVRPEILYAGTLGGVFKSFDGGETWVAKREGLHDELERLPSSGVIALTIDPTNTEVVYAATGEEGVWKSEDGGESWTFRFGGLELEGGGFHGIIAIAVDPVASRTLYATDRGFVFKSTDGAESWQELDLGFDGGLLSIAVHPQTTETLLASSFSGILRSRSGGSRWEGPIPNSPREVHSFVFDPRDPAVLWVGSPMGGVFRSEDGGDTWQVRNQGLPRPELSARGATSCLAGHPAEPDKLYAGTESGVYVRRSGQLGWAPIGANGSTAEVSSLVVDPAGAVYGTTFRGVFRNDPVDRSWRLINEGMTSSVVRTLAVDPTHPDVVFAGVDGAGLHRSDDLGRTWVPFSGNTLADTTISALLVDPNDPSRVLVSCLGATFTSSDGGASWEGEGECIRDELRSFLGPLGNFAIDPSDPNTVFQATGGVRRSSDGGRTWTDVSVHEPHGEFECPALRAIAVDPLDPSIVYAVDSYAGPTKSVDGGVSFARVACPPLFAGSRDGPSAILIDPTNPATVYASSRRGLEKSEDRGETWSRREIGIDPDWAYALAFDPHSSTLYAGTEVGVFRSHDGATTWEPLNDGLLPVPVYALAIDPRDGRTLLAGTAGGAVQRLRLDP
jgi:photosystem II stability/assembly factor-like uncharacterized protein